MAPCAGESRQACRLAPEPGFAGPTTKGTSVTPRHLALNRKDIEGNSLKESKPV